MNKTPTLIELVDELLSLAAEKFFDGDKKKAWLMFKDLAEGIAELKKSLRFYEKHRCVGCGYCCLKVMCCVGVQCHGKDFKVCPSLNWNGERYVCDLADDFHDRLYIGAGCCSNLNTWREDVRERTPVKAEGSVA